MNMIEPDTLEQKTERMMETMRERIAAIPLSPKPPHPDTARADAAERMLADARAVLDTIAAWSTDWKLCTDGNVTAINTFAERALARLDAARSRSALEATERELEGLTR